MSKKIKELSFNAQQMIKDPRYKKQRQGMIGLIVMICFVAISVATNQIYALKNTGYGYGYSSSSYGYGYTYSDYLPDAVTGTSTTVNSTSQITIDWTAVTQATGTTANTNLNNFSYYQICYSTTDTTPDSGDTCSSTNRVISITGTSKAVSGLSVGTLYYFAIYTVDDNSNWSVSSTVESATTNSEGSVVLGGGGAGAPTTTTTTTTSTGYVSAAISATAGGTVTTSQGYTVASVEIPAGALAADGQVSVQSLGAGDVSAPAAGSDAFLIAGLIFQFQVDGGDATFNTPVTLTFTYNDLQVQGLAEENLIVYRWNETSGAWDALESTVDTVNNIITAETTSFSTFAIMAGTGETVVSGTNIPVRGSVIDETAETISVEYFTEITGSSPSADADWQIANFMSYGASAESKSMSQRDRKGVVTDFVDTYGRVPSGAADWNDIAKILSSHRPSQRSLSAEQAALIDFGKVYKRMPDYTNVYDEWALYYMAYNIRPMQRNIDSERFSIGVFKRVYGENPSSADDWAIVRAIAYTGAKR